MIEDIVLTEINQDTLEKMYHQNGYDVMMSFACNHELVKKNIELLKSFGILKIEDLLINRSHLFLKDNEKLLKSFAKFNVANLVNLINEDYTMIDELMDN